MAAGGPGYGANPRAVSSSFNLTAIDGRSSSSRQSSAYTLTRYRAYSSQPNDLRRDPFECADVTSNTYYDWVLDHAYVLLAGQQVGVSRDGRLAAIGYPPGTRSEGPDRNGLGPAAGATGASGRIDAGRGQRQHDRVAGRRSNTRRGSHSLHKCDRRLGNARCPARRAAHPFASAHPQCPPPAGRCRASRGAANRHPRCCAEGRSRCIRWCRSAPCFRRPCRPRRYLAGWRSARSARRRRQRSRRQGP